MRIHKLEIQNIASLKGQHTIDFDKISQESALFAITGKTGAGKSSLLNAISLALYGDVYKKDAQHLDFVTLGEAHGAITLTFSMLSQVYVANWEMKVKKKNGEYYKKPQNIRTLSKQTEDGPIAIEESVEDIIHLNFNQFCKTSILNQGEFAKFLTSSFTERKSILEKFYDGMNLELINQKLKEKIKTNNEQIEKKSHQIQGINQATEEIQITEEELTHKIDLTKKLKNITSVNESIQKELDDLLKSYDNILTNRGRHKELEAKQKEAQRSYNILKSKQDELTELAKKAQKELKERKPTLEICIEKQMFFDKNQEIKDGLTKQKMSYLEDKNKAQRELKTVQERIKHFTEQAQKLKTEYPRAWEVSPEEVLKDKTIYLSTTEKCHTFLELIQKERSAIKSLEEKIKALEGEYKTTQSKREEFDEKLLKKSLETRGQKKEQLLTLLQSLESSLKEVVRLNQSNEQFKSEIAKESQKQKEILETINLKQKEKIPFESTLKLYELEKAAELCLEQSLKDGTCIVCHSPLGDLPSTSKLKSEDREYALEMLDKLDEEIKNLENQNASLQIQLLSLQKNYQQNIDKNGELSAQALVLWNQHNELPLTQKVLKDDSLQIVRDLIAKNDHTLIQNQEKLDLIKLATQKIQTISEQIEENKSVLKDRQLTLTNQENEHKLALKNLKTIGDKYYPEDSQDSEILEKLEMLYTKSSEALQTTNQIDQAEKDKLMYTQAQLHNEQKIQALNENINELVDKNSVLVEFLKLNAHPEIAPKVELNDLQEKHDNAQNVLKFNQEKINQEQIFLAEANSKQESFLEQIHASTLQVQAAQEKLSELMSPEQKIFYMDLEQFDRVPALIKKIVEFEVTNENQKSLLEASLNQFQDFSKRAKQLYIETNQEKIKMQTLYQQKVEGEKQIATINEAIAKDQLIKNKLDNLNDLLGKDEFRNYILSIIESTLIDQTNRELNTLCNGRYSLVQSNKTNRLITEFKIIDHYSDGMIRKLSTLSGGETFLVSLAMALALAELTRGQTQLDSLFIDEGFGTLDQETIEEVYELLLSIQHSGKQIGIISHVKELTNRIPINVNVEKSHAGTSRIQIVNN